MAAEACPFAIVPCYLPNMLFVMVGLPGSGKSTYAASNFRHVVSPDQIRLEQFGTAFDKKIEREVWKRGRARTREILERGDIVCFDATSLSRKRRRSLLVLADEAGAPAVAVWTKSSRQTAWRRNLRRPRSVPRRSFAQMLLAFEPPKMDEGFVGVLVVDSE